MSKPSSNVEELSQLLEKYGAEERKSSVPEGSFSVERSEKFKIYFSIFGRSFCIKRPVGKEAHIHEIKSDLRNLGLSCLK